MTEDKSQPSSPGKGRPARNNAPTGRRKWIFRGVAVVVIPVAFFLLLEGVLALFGYGDSTDFFRKVRGRDAYTTNQRYGWQFFPPALARSPQAFYLPARKDSGTYRIYVLGGSAALGTPSAAYGFGRILEVMLRERYPKGRFEVVPAAMTAINSHVVRDIARQCADRQPDLFVVYMGHNEVVGPYGPGTVFAGFSPSLSMIRAGMWVRTTHLGQLFGSVLGSKPDLTAWKGMEMFAGHQIAADDTRMAKVHEHFRRNLDDVCRIARGAGAKALLCTVPSNLQDCPPFASLHRSGLTDPQKADFDMAYRSANELAQAGDHAAAVGQYLQAAKADDRFAELHFRLARSLLAMGKTAEARKHFVLARDLDSLRFRADSRINEIIRQVAGGREAQGVHLVDIENTFQDAVTALGDGIVGEEFFHEHVHLKFAGDYLAAKTLAQKLGPILPEATRAEAGELPSAQVCAERLALTTWDQYTTLEDVVRMMSRPPFIQQLGHEADQARRTKALEEMRKRLTTESFRRDTEIYRRAIAKAPEDLVLRGGFVGLLDVAGGFADAVEQDKFILERLPDNVQAISNLGVVYMHMGKADQAVESLTKAHALAPDDPTILHNLALALSGQGKSDQAMDRLQEALRLSPKDARLLATMAGLLSGQGKLDQAIERLREAINLQPDAGAAHRMLGDIYLHLKNVDEAIGHYRKAVLLGPMDAPAHNGLGTALMLKGVPAEAVEQFRLAIDINSRHQGYHVNMAGALTSLGRGDEGGVYLERALQLDPNSAGANGMLGALLLDQGQAARALPYLQKAVKLAPQHVVSRARLADALADQRQFGKAVQQYRAILAAHPDLAAAHRGLGLLMGRLGQIDEAIKHLAAAAKVTEAPDVTSPLAAMLALRGRDREAISYYRGALHRQPNWVPAMAGLAWVMATSRDETVRNSKEAIQLATEACELTGFKSASPLGALAAALAEDARFAEAVKAGEKALALAETEKNTQLAKEMREQLALYQAGKAFRRTPATPGPPSRPATRPAAPATQTAPAGM